MSPAIDIAFLAELKYKDRKLIELILLMDLSASGSRGIELRIPDLISAAYAACRIIDFCDLNKEERTFFEETLVESSRRSQSSRDARSSRSSC